VRRDLRGLTLDGREDLIDELLDTRLVGRAPRKIHLTPYPAATDEVQSIAPVVSRHRIDEREGLDGKSQPKKLLLERFQTVQLVTEGRGALELESFAGALHLGAEGVDRSVIGAVEKAARQLHARGVVARGAAADARTETLLHLEADAAGGSWKDAKQLRLVGEVHRMIVGAVAQA